MRKYLDLFKNFGFLTLSNFGSKLLGFFLIPLYTFVLTTEEYGNYDLINVTISLLIPILSLNIADAPIRFLLDKKNNKKDVISISLKYTLLSCIFIIVIAIINKIFNIFEVFNEFFIYFILLYIVNNIYQLLQGITKGEDKLSLLAVSGLINSCLIIILNLLFLLLFKMELDGYFLANIIAIFISIIYLLIKLKILKSKITFKTDKKLEKEMLSYSKPMIFNSIGWWINNVSDRYVVTFLCGLATNGIYSVAYKIPSILSMIQSIFNQAWTVSAIKNKGMCDSNNYYYNVYKICNIVVVMACSILIIFCKLIAKVLYLKDFYQAWVYTPFLMVSVVFGTLAGILGGIFAAEKNTKIIGTSTFISAIVNIVLNIILVYCIGPMGAAISTMISFFIVWLIRVNMIKEDIKQNINFIKDITSYLILILQSLILIANLKFMYLCEIILLVIIFFLYKKDIIKIKREIINILKK